MMEIASPLMAVICVHPSFVVSSGISVLYIKAIKNSILIVVVQLSSMQLTNDSMDILAQIEPGLILVILLQRQNKL